jgi:hypothetical protein
MCSMIDAARLQTLCLTVDYNDWQYFCRRIRRGWGFFNLVPDVWRQTPLLSKQFPALQRMSFVFPTYIAEIWNWDDFEKLFIHYVQRGIVSFPEEIEEIMGRKSTI